MEDSSNEIKKSSTWLVYNYIENNHDLINDVMDVRIEWDEVSNRIREIYFDIVVDDDSW